ncbi:hypothetical protein QC762_405765 [Podospora pseudocomata]|uniref:Uncharacterized protein n=1 Tax=Podospora pseudocomata TaxID=2093779 RepID=A0ABR0GGU3_9PEZI|nr:hypothetical protein QC762_405765 [Podospora pseudocomata]
MAWLLMELSNARGESVFTVQIRAAPTMLPGSNATPGDCPTHDNSYNCPPSCDKGVPGDMISGEGDIVQLDKMYNQMKTERDAATAEVAYLKAKPHGKGERLDGSFAYFTRMFSDMKKERDLAKKERNVAKKERVVAYKERDWALARAGKAKHILDNDNASFIKQLDEVKLGIEDGKQALETAMAKSDREMKKMEESYNEKAQEVESLEGEVEALNRQITDLVNEAAYNKKTTVNGVGWDLVEGDYPELLSSKRPQRHGLPMAHLSQRLLNISVGAQKSTFCQNIALRAVHVPAGLSRDFSARTYVFRGLSSI